LWIWNSWRPQFLFDITSAKELIGFGSKILISSLLDTIYVNIYTVIIGKKYSNEDLSYFDPMTNEKYVPYCIEPSVGVERLLLAILTDAYDEEILAEDDSRTVLRFHPYIAPVKAAVLPLSKKLGDDALKVFEMIRKRWNAEYDDTQSIGKRYRRQDEIGTPFCFTYDFDSLNDNCVTVRYRGSMKTR
jgi:glycyl-tRNA synthetase